MSQAEGPTRVSRAFEIGSHEEPLTQSGHAAGHSLLISSDDASHAHRTMLPAPSGIRGASRMASAISLNGQESRPRTAGMATFSRHGDLQAVQRTLKISSMMPKK